MGRQWSSAYNWQARTATSDTQPAYTATRTVGLAIIAVGALSIIEGLLSSSLSSSAVGAISVIAGLAMRDDNAA